MSQFNRQFQLSVQATLLGMILSFVWGVQEVRSGSISDSLARTLEARSSSGGLRAIWTGSGMQQELTAWTLSDLMRLKRVMAREKDPETGRWVHWEGVLLSYLLDLALENLPVERRAQVDLVLLKSRSGQTAFIPRALIGKYPLMLALPVAQSEEGGPQGENGTQSTALLHSVVPWSSKPKILTEELPLESFYISDVTRVELTSYQDRFSSFFLKRRTDPSAIRGEKIFVQNCVCCHGLRQSAPSSWESLGSLASFSKMKGDQAVRSLSSQRHPRGSFIVSLNERDRRSIVRYLEAHKLENPPSVSSVFHP